MEKAYLDCYAVYDEEKLVIGNALIERWYVFNGSVLVPTAVRNKDSGYCWESGGLPPLMNAPESAQGALRERRFLAEVRDDHGLAREHLSLLVTSVYARCTQEKEFILYPGLPFVALRTRIKGKWFQGVAASEEGVHPGIELGSAKAEEAIFSGGDAIDLVPLTPTHLKVTAVNLYDKTDHNDTLTAEDIRLLYPRGSYAADGNLFFIEDYLRGEALLIVKDSPPPASTLDRKAPDIVVHGNRYAELLGSGLKDAESYDEYVYSYGSVIGVGSREELPGLFKHCYNRDYQPSWKANVLMANTWGDRGQDASISEEFIRREVLAAEEIGIDVLQIDDGWQLGTTPNSRLSSHGVWSGYYEENERFWSVHPLKFPRGLSPLVAFAREHHVALGLWFSPDSSDDYANWTRDIDTVLHLHEEYGIAFFKIDAVSIKSKIGERRFHSFLSEVSRASHNAVTFNLDITADNRFGYLYHRQFGTIFVENRYTDWGNYYPHNTLRNLWTLSRYFPTRKFQFELLNNTRNSQQYGKDALAPSTYTIDYEFAAVAVSNPLFWMELSAVPAAEKALLQRAVSWYRACRDDFWNAEVFPVGQLPDGQSFTGFQLVCAEEEGYLLLFRENTNAVSHTFELPRRCAEKSALTFVASNREQDSITFRMDSDTCTVSFGTAKSFVLLRYAGQRGCIHK